MTRAEGILLKEMRYIASISNGQVKRVAEGALASVSEYLATEPSGERAALINRQRYVQEHGANPAMRALAKASADMLEADAQRITELDALSVTKIMIDVVPGDGAGLEVFAKSTSDVEDLLTKMDEKIEDFESSKWAQQAKRVPMTDDEIDGAWNLYVSEMHFTHHDLVRFVEAHHGITPADKPTDWSAA